MPSALDRLVKLCQSVNVAAQGIWLGSLVATAALAASIFPMMRNLRPTLATYPAFTGDHAPLTAGHIAARAFLVNDFVQFICAGLALFSLSVLIIIQLRRPVSVGGGRSPRLTLRATAFGLALTVFCVQFFVVAPGMDATLREYWAAAADGNNTLAESLRVRFSQAHPLAANLMAATAGLVLISLLISAWPARSPLPAADPNAPPPSPPRTSDGPRLEVPALARGRA